MGTSRFAAAPIGGSEALAGSSRPRPTSLQSPGRACRAPACSPLRSGLLVRAGDDADRPSREASTAWSWGWIPPTSALPPNEPARVEGAGPSLHPVRPSPRVERLEVFRGQAGDDEREKRTARGGKGRQGGNREQLRPSRRRLRKRHGAPVTVACQCRHHLSLLPMRHGAMRQLSAANTRDAHSNARQGEHTVPERTPISVRIDGMSIVPTVLLFLVVPPVSRHISHATFVLWYRTIVIHINRCILDITPKTPCSVASNKLPPPPSSMSCPKAQKRISE